MCFPTQICQFTLFMHHPHLWFKFENFLKQRMLVRWRQFDKNIKVKIRLKPTFIWNPKLRVGNCWIKSSEAPGWVHKQDSTLKFVYMILKSFSPSCICHGRMPQKTLICTLLHGFIPKDQTLL